jgi:hypothetical protein
MVARSSAEAEYRAMASASCELIWPKNLLIDLDFHNHTPMTLFSDNQVVMLMQLIKCFMNAQNTLKWIVIIFVS